VVFLLVAFILYIVVLCWAVLQFSWGRDTVPECEGDYQNWMALFMAGLIFNVTIARVIKYQMGHRRNQPEPRNVKLFNIGTCVFYIVFYLVGVVLSTLDSNAACKEADPQAFNSWQALCIFGFAVQFMIWGGVGIFATFMLYLARNGMLNDGDNAAPSDTVEKLETVSAEVANKNEACCAICLEEFGGNGGGGGGGEEGMEAKRTHCGHVFHQRCLENWFKVAKSCPVCRKDVAGAVASGGSNV